MKPAGGRFPETRYSILEAVSEGDEDDRRQAFDSLAEGYWKPVYKYLRLSGKASADDAVDLTQDFFTRALEKNFFAGYDPSKARFRTYLRTCLDRFVANQRRNARRLKRGGGAVVESLDFDAAEGEIRALPAAKMDDPDALFHREWMRNVIERAVAALAERCARDGYEERFTAFEQYDLAEQRDEERPTYAEVGRRLGLPVTQVTNHLHWARRELRRLLLEEVRALTASEEEYRAEVRALLGIDPS